MGWIEKMQTCNFENEDFLEIDISRGISGAQKLMLRYSSNLAVIVVCEDSVCTNNIYSNICIAY